MNEMLKTAQDKEKLPVLDDSIEGFRIQRVDDKSKDLEIIAKKDKNGDFPIMSFSVLDNNNEQLTFAIDRDEMAAITFALSRQDQQSKLLDARFREYGEKMVRLVVIANKDIKKGEPVVIYRKEKVPIDATFANSFTQ